MMKTAVPLPSLARLPSPITAPTARMISTARLPSPVTAPTARMISTARLLLPRASLPSIVPVASDTPAVRSTMRSRFRLWTRPGGSVALRARASAEGSGAAAGAVGEVDDGRMVAAAGLTVALAVVNRVLYKLALVPMKEYPFFMAQLTTFGYVAIYFSILYGRFRSGIVTKEMLQLPKSRFLAIGFLEALGVASGMSAGAMLPGPAIPILSQSFLVWQLIFSASILRRRYSFNQILGCLLVAGGVIIAVASGTTDGQLLSKVGYLWPALMIASSAFQAGASILKEFVFINASKHLQGKALDIFVVNSFGSGFQALFLLLLLPFLSNMKGIPFPELPSYLESGAGCFLNIDVNATGCDGAPWLPLIYICVNMAFNISALRLLKISSAVVSSLTTILAVPISIYILSLPLPFIPQGARLGMYFVLGAAILVLGLMLYNLPQSAVRSKSDSRLTQN